MKCCNTALFGLTLVYCTYDNNQYCLLLMENNYQIKQNCSVLFYADLYSSMCMASKDMLFSCSGDRSSDQSSAYWI